MKRPKRELIRIVRTPEGEVRCDSSGRLNGRGAYLSLDDGCVQVALGRGILSRQFGMVIDNATALSLIEQVESERLARVAGRAR